MPIYEYRCSSCGHQQEFLQKLSDVPLTVCTKCNQPSFSKMLTAAGFQLKGSGWYATDFKSKAPAATAKADAAKPQEKQDTQDKKGGEGKAAAATAGGCGAGGCAACQ